MASDTPDRSRLGAVVADPTDVRGSQRVRTNQLVASERLRSPTRVSRCVEWVSLAAPGWIQQSLLVCGIVRVAGRFEDRFFAVREPLGRRHVRTGESCHCRS